MARAKKFRAPSEVESERASMEAAIDAYDAAEDGLRDAAVAFAAAYDPKADIVSASSANARSWLRGAAIAYTTAAAHLAPAELRLARQRRLAKAEGKVA